MRTLVVAPSWIGDAVLSHPLLARVQAALAREGKGVRPGAVYYARRCVYRRRQGLLLVTEVFLPAVLNLVAAATNTK